MPLIGDFEIFRNALATTGEDPTKYGITATEKIKCESYWFNLGQMGSGHGTNSAIYSSTFKIDFKNVNNNLEKIETSQIEIGYTLYALGRSKSGAIAIIYYTDGTTDKQEIEQGYWGGTKTGSLVFSVDNSKEINYITLQIQGYDADYTSSYGYFENVILKDCDFSNLVTQP